MRLAAHPLSSSAPFFAPGETLVRKSGIVSVSPQAKHFLGDFSPLEAPFAMALDAGHVDAKLLRITSFLQISIEKCAGKDAHVEYIYGGPDLASAPRSARLIITLIQQTLLVGSTWTRFWRVVHVQEEVMPRRYIETMYILVLVYRTTYLDLNP